MIRQILPLSMAIAMAMTSLPAFAQEQTAMLNISATGTVVASPDMAVVNSGVITDGKTAREALSANNEAMTSLIEVLKQAGIDPKHIQTSNFSIQPNYVHSSTRDHNGYNLPPKVNGYRVSNMVTVNVMDLNKLGTVLDQAVTVGANSIDGVSFAVADPSALLDEARKKAMAEAINNANIYADAANIKLDQIMSISENTHFQPQPYGKMRNMEMAMSEPVAMQAGELDYSITVNVGWKITQ